MNMITIYRASSVAQIIHLSKQELQEMLGEYHGQRSLVGYSPWGQKELDTTEAT